MNNKSMKPHISITRVLLKALLKYYNMYARARNLLLLHTEKTYSKMNKRIKTVWVLSIATMVLILCGQAYWLTTQYKLVTDIHIEQLKTACTEAMKKEQEWRYDIASKKDTLENSIKKTYTINFNRKTRASGANDKIVKSSVTFTMPGEKKRRVLKDIGMYDALDLQDRYIASHRRRFDKHCFDSLLTTAGHDTTQAFSFYKTRRCMVKPVFTVSGTFSKQLNVRYSTNPLDFEAVAFSIAVKPGEITSAMGWQLVGSTVLVLVLTFCLAYQMKTIIIQKRIDGIRHEFMKNMIYEMKQPPAVEPAASEAVNIGETAFFYSLNELRHGAEKVIITSRQAEILQLLAERKNEVVSREELLTEVWGDDSYANSMALNVQITYLRRALRSDTTVCIEAVIKKGYILKVKK